MWKSHLILQLQRAQTGALIRLLKGHTGAGPGASPIRRSVSCRGVGLLRAERSEDFMTTICITKSIFIFIPRLLALRAFQPINFSHSIDCFEEGIESIRPSQPRAAYTPLPASWTPKKGLPSPSIITEPRNLTSPSPLASALTDGPHLAPRIVEGTLSKVNCLLHPVDPAF